MTELNSIELIEFYEMQDPRDLVIPRAFLGLYTGTSVNLGAKDSSYQNLTRSRARDEPSRYRLDNKTTASAGTSVSSFNFTLATKIVKQEGLRVMKDQSQALLESRLKNSQSQPMLMFDTGDQRVWLVPELHVMLHLTYASLSYDKDTADLLPNLPHISDVEDPEAAYSKIFECKDFQIRDKTQSMTGSPQYFIDFVKQILVSFEKRKEQVLVRESGPKPSIRASKRRTLHGWDIDDLIKGSMLCKRRMTTLKKSAGDWYRIFKHQPGILALFC